MSWGRTRHRFGGTAHIDIIQWKALCVNEREWERGGRREKSCESERKCGRAEKCRSLESGCSGVKKVSAHVGTSSTVAVWENWGIFSGLFGIIEVRPSAGVCVSGALVVQRGGEKKGKGRGFGP